MRFFTLSGFRLCTTTLILLLISCGSNNEEDLEEVGVETPNVSALGHTGTWWEGYMHVRSEYNGVIYDASRTEIYFEADWNKVRKGKGYWIDHYTDAPWGSYFASHISWSVHEGIIDITFLDERDEQGNQESIQIRDGSISNGHFKGWIPATNSGERLEFDLHKVNHDDNYYNNYYYGWDYWRNRKPAFKVPAHDTNIQKTAKPAMPIRTFQY